MPKIVTSRLAEREANSRAGAASHPEADLLTAFIEQALPERERSAVMTHLASCGTCREIVGLAQPQSGEATTEGVLIRSRPRLSRGLLLRWGALAACAALAVSLVVFQKKQPSRALVAEKQIAEPITEPSVSKQIDAESAKKSEPTATSEPPLRGRFGSEPASTRREADAATGTYLKSKREAVPLAPGPSPMNNNAGFIAKNTISNSNTVTNERNLPLNGRDVIQLSQLAGASAGAAGADSKLAKAPAVEAGKANVANREEANVTQEQDKVARRKDDGARAKQGKSLVVGGVSGIAEVGARAIPGETRAATAAQVGEGEIRGVVVDPLGAVVSDAKVTITNTATGVSIVSATNSAGIYEARSVPPGSYTVTVSKAGFREFVRPSVNVTLPATDLDAKLQVGAVSEQVEVTAAAPTTVETSSAYVATTKDELRASSAPLANMGVLGKALQAATWQITDAGDLQRSFDGGKTWESVSLGQPAKLRVVATTGLHVWAGGHGGALFHSSDGGSHFTQVTAHAGQITLAGDIVMLNFLDAKHGRIETVDHEVWTTSNGGKSWLISTAK